MDSSDFYFIQFEKVIDIQECKKYIYIYIYIYISFRMFFNLSDMLE